VKAVTPHDSGVIRLYGMNFRAKAFTLHIGASACVLGLTLGSLYLGWYRWPGWYVTGALTIAAILIAVDLTLGPLFTLLIANPKKPRRMFARDLAVIATVQIVALVYGASALWIGRPLYYVFWVNQLKVVAASEVPSSEAALMRKDNPELAPRWYSTPRWVWAPLPAGVQDTLRARGAAAADPRRAQEALAVLLKTAPAAHDFRPLPLAGDELRAQLRRVDQMSIFSREERERVKQRMAERGLPPDSADALFLSGFEHPLVAVFDPASLTIKALIRTN
jgi:hypothetical protein